jgi:ribosomal RNA assembly protein
MQTIYVKRIKNVQKNRAELEKTLRVKIAVDKNQVTVDGDTMEEYDASRIFDAINFGFSLKKALLLKNENYVFKVVKIKEHTRRSLPDVKSRLIGKSGKTRRVFADISGCEIFIADAEVGVIGDVLDVQDTETAIISLIRGAKQTNMYRYLEKQNKNKKEKTSFFDLPR